LRKVALKRNLLVMRTPDSLLSVAQAAEELDVPIRTLQYRITTGKVAAVKVGAGRTSSYVITREEVDRLLDEQEKASA